MGICDSIANISGWEQDTITPLRMYQIW